MIVRLKRIRKGKTVWFADFQGISEIQIGFRLNQLSESCLKTLKEAGIGDVFHLMQIKTEKKQNGSEGLFSYEIYLVQKCQEVLQFGNNYDGKIVDREKDQRDLSTTKELIYNESLREALIERTLYLTKIRQRLNKLGMYEVTTPAIESVYGGAEAEPFITKRKGKDMYLRVSPEINLKKLVTALCTGVYEIGPAFRNEGIDRTHSPEFTLLEAYFVEEVNISGHDYLSELLDVFEIELNKSVDYSDYPQENKLPLGWVSVRGYPASENPFCTSNNGIAERTVLYYNRLEIMEIYSEETDPISIEKNFPNRPDFVEIARLGIPPMIGIGFGVERMLVAKYGGKITDYMSFKFSYL